MNTRCYCGRKKLSDYDRVSLHEHLYPAYGHYFCSELCCEEFLSSLPGVEGVRVYKFRPGHFKELSFELWTKDGESEYYNLNYYSSKKKFEDRFNLF